jgi:hypothetical protein
MIASPSAGASQGHGEKVTFSLSGPGTVASTTLVPGQDPQVAAEQCTSDNLSFVGGPVDQTLFLQSGSTAVQAQLIITGLDPCTVVGSAIPLG